MVNFHAILTTRKVAHVSVNSNILVRQPAPHDLLGTALFVAGIGASFEGSFYARIRDGHGHELADYAYIQGSGGWLQPFGATLEVPESSTVEGTVEVWGDNPSDEAPAEPDKVIVPIVFGNTLVPGGYLGTRCGELRTGTHSQKSPARSTATTLELEATASFGLTAINSKILTRCKRASSSASPRADSPSPAYTRRPVRMPASNRRVFTVVVPFAQGRAGRNLRPAPASATAVPLIDTDIECVARVYLEPGNGGCPRRLRASVPMLCMGRVPRPQRRQLGGRLGLRLRRDIPAAVPAHPDALPGMPGETTLTARTPRNRHFLSRPFEDHRGQSVWQSCAGAVQRTCG